MNVNYIDEFESFMRYARNNALSGRERNLWVALFHIANDRAVYNSTTGKQDWPGDFFPVPNGELTLNSTLDKRGIEQVRNQLKQRGLIDFRPGVKNKKPPEYKLNYISVNVGYKIVPNYVPKDVPNSVPKDVPNSVPNMSPFLKDKDIDKDKRKENDIFADDQRGAREESAADEYMRRNGIDAGDEATTAEAGKIALSLMNEFAGRNPVPYDTKMVLQEVRQYRNGEYGIDRDRVQLLTHAFSEAVRNGCPGNWRYIQGCMRRFETRGITDLDGAEDYEYAG